MQKAKAWKEKIVIPTYEIGEAEKLPVFLEKRVYQGSSGVVYPHPVVESISTEKKEKEWNVIYAENEYIKIMVIPDLGGRIHMAYDKIKERHFIYHNQVIKPALVGLTGPWISGGIEFNWPQHHRPSTYQAIDSKIEHNEDGSVTIWVNELEKMFGLKGMAGFTLHPDKAYIEIVGKIYNRTAYPQTFLWWANPAVRVNDHYQSVFPPDVNAVFDHGKRDVSTFPIAKGTYYKVDYSPGTDISKYKNIPVPTSYMAVNSKYDFVGCYEHDTQAGMLHVSDHHVSPGKKQWTWGHGDFGQAWDRNLTDEDGPYIEIMCGVYTDNQPDFTWIQPLEEKTFTQYFMPYHSVGTVKNASKDLVANVVFENNKAILKIYATSSFENLSIILNIDEKTVINEVFNINPHEAFIKTFDQGPVSDEKVNFVIKNSKGDTLLKYQGEILEEKAIPDPATAPDFPSEVEQIEDLYFIGQHLEQYRHATYRPEDYYLEALKRDDTDLRCNNAMGLIMLRKGKLKEAEQYFRKSIEKITKRNPNPSDGEFHYNLGLCLFRQGKLKEAFNYFSKSTWSDNCKELGNYYLAAILCQEKRYEAALAKIEESLLKNSRNHKGRHLKVHLLNKLNLKEDALILARKSLKLDPFNFGILFEIYFESQDANDLSFTSELMRFNHHNFMECAQDFALLGDLEKAIAVLKVLEDRGVHYPMLDYFSGHYYHLLGNSKLRDEYWTLAEKRSMDYCFPNRSSELFVLEKVVQEKPDSPNAHYYIGNYWYAKREHDLAKNSWTKSVELEENNPIAHRNLALFYYNKAQETQNAQDALLKAFSLDGNNSRLLMELDQFYKKTNACRVKRLQLLEEKWPLVLERDDLYLEYITLLNMEGQYEKALKLIAQRKFQPWEGGEGKVPTQYLTTRIEIAKKLIFNGQYEEAIDHLQEARHYPHNLGEGKLFGARENDIFYWLGVAHEELLQSNEAKTYWEMGAEGDSTIGQAFFYNDQQPDKIFYQGLCLKKLGQDQLAHKIFNDLIVYGSEHASDKIVLDYFAISLPDLLIWEEDLDLRNKINCYYLEGLGHLGKGAYEKAKNLFEKALDSDHYHLGCQLHLTLLEENKKILSHGVL